MSGPRGGASRVLGLEHEEGSSGPGAGTRRVLDACYEWERRRRTACVFCTERTARRGWDEDERCPSCWGVVKLDVADLVRPAVSDVFSKS